MTIRGIEGEPLRFFAVSDSRRGVEHLVDLTGRRGAGECGCEHFQMVLDKAGGGDCKHIAAVRVFAESVIKKNFGIKGIDENVVAQELLRIAIAAAVRSQTRPTKGAVDDESKADGGDEESQ